MERGGKPQSVRQILDLLYPNKKLTVFDIIKKSKFTPNQKRLLFYINGFPNIDIPDFLNPEAKELFKLGIISKNVFYYIIENNLREFDN